LGQGQGPTAEKLIANARVSGDWVLLQNCMLAKSWMPRLEELVLNLAKERDEIHDDFRLFLTSSPVSYFPVTVLQNGVKMTNEPPMGIRANILRSFETLVKPEDFETPPGLGERAWKKILVGLSYFHAVAQERRKFGALGWNIRYGFDESDIESSIAVLYRMLDQQKVIPWDALRYIIGQINYGGRVTDDWDRRTLTVLLKKYMDIPVLEDGYKVSASGKYYIPDLGPYKSFTDYFSQLPLADSPEIFGMHDNANIAFQRNGSVELVNNILGLQPRSSGGGDGMSSDDIVANSAGDFQAMVPGNLLEEDAGETTFVIMPNGLLSSIATVLTQEMVKFNRLLNAIRSTLIDLKKAIQGQIVMSLDLDKMYTSFLNTQVPELWSRVGFASLKGLASWFVDLIARIEFLQIWVKNGEPPSYALNVFFFPQGFMTGNLQTYARKYQVAIDTLTFKFTVFKGSAEDITEGPEDGVFCTGMWIEAARWDKDAHVLKESYPSEMFAEMAPVHLMPQPNYDRPLTEYACPVYKTTERKGALSTTGMSTNFVVAVDLPTDVDPDSWVLQGTAMHLNLLT